MNQEHLQIRLGEESDQKYLVEWLLQPSVLDGFPLADLREVEDAARIWVSYTRFGAVLTALWDGVPCGIANLYIPPYKKMSHQSLFAIIVDEKFRGKGIGTKLLSDLIEIAKNQFKMEFLHLEVYEGNPARNLYERMGFVQYGIQRHFVKDEGVYKAKIMMQKRI